MRSRSRSRQARNRDVSNERNQSNERNVPQFVIERSQPNTRPANFQTGETTEVRVPVVDSNIDQDTGGVSISIRYLSNNEPAQPQPQPLPQPRLTRQQVSARNEEYKQLDQELRDEQAAELDYDANIQ
jgi:hypothetical protein